MLSQFRTPRAPPLFPEAADLSGVHVLPATAKVPAPLAQDKVGQVIPVVITVYEDRSFTFILKTPPASELIKQAAKIQRGSGDPSKTKVGSITQDQLKEIASIKLPDLNCTSVSVRETGSTRIRPFLNRAAPRRLRQVAAVAAGTGVMLIRCSVLLADGVGDAHCGGHMPQHGRDCGGLSWGWGQGSRGQGLLLVAWGLLVW